MREGTQPTTALDIGDRQIGVVVRRGEVAEARLTLAFGALQLAEEILSHDPPRAAELESAIDAVEGQLTAAVGVAAAESSLVLVGPLAKQLAQVHLADGGSATVGLETIESLFQRLASEALGNPAARRGLPAGNAFMAGVLILREFMHHLGFGSVTIETQPH
jgi:exopolyphosphatase/pppGpp-phosphohydrolase